MNIYRLTCILIYSFFFPSETVTWASCKRISYTRTRPARAKTQAASDSEPIKLRSPKQKKKKKSPCPNSKQIKSNTTWNLTHISGQAYCDALFHLSKKLDEVCIVFTLKNHKRVIFCIKYIQYVLMRRQGPTFVKKQKFLKTFRFFWKCLGPKHFKKHSNNTELGIPHKDKSVCIIPIRY